MPLNRRTAFLPAKIVIVIWGLISVVQGSLLDVVHKQHTPYAYLELIFVHLVYSSVLVGGFFSFVSSRATAIALAGIALAAVGIVIRASSVHDGMGLYRSTGELIAAIFLRPGATSLILFIISEYERRLTSRGPN